MAGDGSALVTLVRCIDWRILELWSETTGVVACFRYGSWCVPVLRCRYIHCAAEYSICLLVCLPTQRSSAVQFHTFEACKVCTFTRSCAVSVLLYKQSEIHEIATLKFQESKCTAIMPILWIQRQTKLLIISGAVFSHIVIGGYSCLLLLSSSFNSYLFEAVAITVRSHWEVLRRNQSCADCKLRLAPQPTCRPSSWGEHYWTQHCIAWDARNKMSTNAALKEAMKGVEDWNGFGTSISWNFGLLEERAVWLSCGHVGPWVHLLWVLISVGAHCTVPSMDVHRTARLSAELPMVLSIAIYKHIWLTYIIYVYKLWLWPWALARYCSAHKWDYIPLVHRKFQRHLSRLWICVLAEIADIRRWFKHRSQICRNISEEMPHYDKYLKQEWRIHVCIYVYIYIYITKAR